MRWGRGCDGDGDAMGTGVRWGRGCDGDEDAMGTRMRWGRGCDGEQGLAHAWRGLWPTCGHRLHYPMRPDGCVAQKHC
jgi:hypothetical protein